jgi:hypothetical protein
MAKRIIWGTVLTLVLNLSPNPAPAFLLKGISTSGEETPAPGRMLICLKTKAAAPYPQDFGASETSPFPDVNPFRDGRFWLHLPSPPKPLAPLLPLAFLELNSRSLLSVGLPDRFEPGNLPDRVLTHARYYLNTPYRSGGSLRTGRGTDCSGFVQYIYHNFNIDLPRASAQQARVGKLAARTMDFSQLRPGDLLFFSRGRRIGHVGIYLGKGEMIHASIRRRGVAVTDLRQPYYEDSFVVAKRLF